MFNSIRFGLTVAALTAFLAGPAQAISDTYRDLSARLVTDAEQQLLQQKQLRSQHKQEICRICLLPLLTSHWEGLALPMHLEKLPGNLRR